MILESGQYAIILRKIIHLSVRFLSHRKFLCLTRKISQNSKLEDYVNSPEVHRNTRHILGSSIWYYAIISNLVSVASKLLLHHRNNIPKLKLSTWKLVSPVVHNSILKLAFGVKQPKKTKIMHRNFSNSFLVTRLKGMLIGCQKEPIYISASIVCDCLERSWYKKILASMSLNLPTESEFLDRGP